ncbi:type III restriction endonuclease StyLTI [Tetragenococcus halophilus subsp. flandriensis]|uniref:site-specific DNA-methyltransferase n=1 Tax=Tetragenococcus halophilus TaxID=51669 RepID=UPI0023E941FE|nr:site-specific DNA-methyltransferase [Tetragenococcus halophilus]GMA09116.1 type III restriction endonuclease StyLTI [Tetragenococcus halophilus subsp. flandriensis]
MDKNFNKGLRANIEYNNNVKANTDFLNNLKEKLPEFFADSGSFDLEKFKENLQGNNIDELSSGYRLDFIGKNYAKKQAGEKPTSVIVPEQVHNKKTENKNSENLFFTGDNLEVLRHLQQNYANSVDFIYIDPPYNTGSDGFVYPDKFEYNDDQLKSMFGLNEEELIRLKSIQGKSNHSAWLAFMYPRLYIAKKLLKDTGVIFISIDDNEQGNLKLLMDELFGEGSFLSTIIWERAYSPVNLKKHFSDSHDYLLVYAKNMNHLVSNGLPRSNEANARYSNPDHDPRGSWQSADLSVGPAVESNIYEIMTPSGRKVLPPNGYSWRLSKERFTEFVNEGRIWFGEDGDNVPRIKRFLSEVKQTVIPMSIWKHQDVGHSQSASQDLKKLFNGNSYFTYPKPIGLIKQTLQLYTQKDSIVLDFFAGSATTADAVMQLNVEDGGNRKYIMVQLDEQTKSNSTAFKDGYITIDQISRARIEKAAEKIKNENPKVAEEQDFGFKHYRVLQPKQEALDTIEFNSDIQLDMFDDMINVFSSESLDVPGHASGFDTILQTYMVSDNYKFDVPIKFVDFVGIELPYVNESRIYLISNDWTSRNTKALVNAIGKNELTVQTIVVYGYTIEMESIRELEIALNQLENKVNLQVRY